MNPSFDLDDVNHFTAGAVGEPGRRVFLLQGGQGKQLVTIKLEKQQVAALSAYLGQLVAGLARPGHLPEDLDLRGPLEIAWIGGEISAVYEETSDRIVVTIVEAVTEDPDESASQVDTIGPAAIFRITREQAAAFAIRGMTLVESGRPPCPLCGHPIDPSGHACPRTNGNRPPAP